MLLKDNVDATGTATTAGSRALAGSRPSDATLTRELRDAGAIVLGKANLSEWANFRSTHATSGWSGVGGQTNNPYVLDRNPCGSSSGSAAGVAASLAQVAIGTETDGSIVCPSGANGDVGIKPTLGMVSRTGVVPISDQQDTAGPIARHAIDAALTLQAISGTGPHRRGHPAPAGGHRPALRLARPGTRWRGARIGVWDAQARRRRRPGDHRRLHAGGRAAAGARRRDRGATSPTSTRQQIAPSSTTRRWRWTPSSTSRSTATWPAHPASTPPTSPA